MTCADVAYCCPSTKSAVKLLSKSHSHALRDTAADTDTYTCISLFVRTRKMAVRKKRALFANYTKCDDKKLCFKGLGHFKAVSEKRAAAYNHHNESTYHAVIIVHTAFIASQIYLFRLIYSGQSFQLLPPFLPDFH